jgi:hypothetical protein
MLTSKVTKRLDVPHEPGEYVEIRRLSWRTLQRAQDAQKADAYQHVKTLGKEGMDAVRDVTPEQIAAFRKDHASKYDRHVLLSVGIVAWSYSDKPTDEEVDELDAATADFVVDELLKLAGVVPDEADQKNA